jgi:hypothetical protein
MRLATCNKRFARDQIGKNPCESVKSASSVVYEFEESTETDAAHQRLEARLFAKALEKGLHFQVDHVVRVLVLSLFEPV